MGRRKESITVVNACGFLFKKINITNSFKSFFFSSKFLCTNCSASFIFYCHAFNWFVLFFFVRLHFFAHFYGWAEIKETTKENAAGTPATIQRRRRPKRRSTGVVQIDMEVPKRINVLRLLLVPLENILLLLLLTTSTVTTSLLLPLSLLSPLV